MENAVSVCVQDQSHAAEARRAAMRLASGLAFDETEAGNVGLVVTEAVRNLLKHAGGGDLFLRAVTRNGSAAVEMLAVDKGPGFENIRRSFEDGYSTTGTMGGGLGAISRLSTCHDIYSLPGNGAALMARIYKRNGSPRPARAAEGRFRIGAVTIPKNGEPVCGDAWGHVELPRNGLRLVVADGLGHGLLAADAARACVRVVEENAGQSGVELMQRIHAALRPTRGAAVAVAEIDCERRVLRYVGVGNISGHILKKAGPVQGMVSHSGTAGHEVHRFAEFTYPWPSGSILVMHSDGLHTHWSLDRYPGLLERHPSLLAGVLYRDFNRGRDDVTVVTLREAEDE